MFTANDFQSRIEARLLDIKDCTKEKNAELLAAEAKGYVEAARQFELIKHDDFKKANAEIEHALLEWCQKAKRSTT